MLELEDIKGVGQAGDLEESIKGIGPETARKLVKWGICTVESLAIATISDVVAAGVGEATAAKIIEQARDMVALTFIRADEFHRMRQSVDRLTTGSKALDQLVGGGIETQGITEVHGTFRSGKTQLCHQLCCTVQLPREQGGLEAGALYFDTEQTFHSERLVQIAQRFGMDPEKVLEGVVYAEAYTSDHQIFLLEHADKIIKENGVRLIVVDSLTSHFRSDYLGRETLADRQQKLNRHMHKLARLARVFNVAAVVTNQMISNPSPYGILLNPAGGNIVAHASHTRLSFIAGKGHVRKARLIDSSYLPEGEILFQISERGIEDYLEKA